MKGDTLPAIMTHDFFGKDAYSSASTQLGLLSLAEHDAFLLGNQGPDPLFYLLADPQVPASNRIGDLMHSVRPARLLVSLHDALSMLSRSEASVGRAYAAGFLCHYALDSAMHPLVYFNEYAICDAGVEGLDRRDGGLVHAEVERDFDEMVLYTKLHKTVADYKPYKEVLAADDPTLAVIDKLFFYMALWTYSRTLDLDCYTHAVKAFRLVQHLFYSPGQRKTAVLSPLERAFTHNRYSLYHAMAHRDRAELTSDFDNHEHQVWRNPFSGEESTTSFWDIYEDALEGVTSLHDRFFERDFDLEDAEEITGNLNFSGQPTDPDDTEEPHEPPVGVAL